MKNIENNKSIIIINKLKAGKYAFKYFHDENKNMVLDLSWFGIPNEGFGFANNAKGNFGSPAFEKTIVAVNKNITLYCTPQFY